MDPHSRHSQFNMRAPKSGPQALNVRFAADGVNISSPSSPSLSTSTTTKRSSSSSQSTSGMSLVVPIPTKKPKTGNGSVRRPIATNSRIEQMQDEKMKKDMYLAFILDALDKMSKGITAPFNELLDQFNPHKQASSSQSSQSSQSSASFSPASLRLWLSSLSHVVSRLEPIHSPLIHSIVQMPWTTFDPSTVRSYTVFIGMLVSARPEYLSMVLGMVVRGFTYHSGLKATHIHPSPTSPSSPPLTRRLIYTRLHSLLSHLLTLIPTLPSTLEPLLISNFPHKRHDLKSQVTYIRNLLRVSGYCPEIGHTVLGTVVDRAIQIDVEIQVEIEELEALETQSDTEVFTLDPFDTLIGQESDHSDTEEAHDDDEDIDDNMSDLSSSGGFDDDEDTAPREELRAKPKMIHEMVKKLDAILELVFEYFQESRESITGSSTTTGGEEVVQPLSALPPLPDLPPLESPSLLTPTAMNPFYPFPSISAPPQLQTVLPPTPTLSSSSIPPSISNPGTPSLPSTTLKSQKRTRASLLSQFHTLLSIFDRTILRTFKSRYTQFLVFWYTSLDREFSDLFQGMLVERALLGSGDDSMGGANDFGGGGGMGTGMGGGGGLRAITPTVTRAAAASYIGSYVSRAEFVNGEETRAIVGVLCAFLGGHMDDIEDELRESGALTVTGGATRATNAAANVLVGSTAQNTVWYAVVQAVFLIFCFRWRDLLVDEDGEALDGGEVDVEVLVGVGESRFGGGGSGDGVGGGGRWLPGLSVLKRVVQCVLNPLKVCSPNVVNQFAKIAHTTNFLYCYTILEANKRSDYSSSSTSSTSSTSPPDPNIPSGGIHPAILESAVNPELNSFFPFDPYRLPRSGRFIEGIYREWGSVAVGDDDEDESDEDEDEDEELINEDQEEMEEEEEERDDMKADLGGYLSGPRSSSPVMIFGGGRGGEDKEEDEEELGQSLDKVSISPMRPGLKARMGGM